jgi:hypothetical protein
MIHFFMTALISFNQDFGLQDAGLALALFTTFRYSRMQLTEAPDVFEHSLSTKYERNKH